MNLSNIRSCILGIIPMTLIHYYYWNWLTTSITSYNIQMYEPLLFPAILTTLYCIYEKFIVFPPDVTWQDKMPLTIFWVIECVIGVVNSTNLIYDKFAEQFFTGIYTMWSPISGAVFLAYLTCFRLLFHKK